MNYLKKFETNQEYSTYTASTEFVTPNVSLCKNENAVRYSPIPPHDYSQDYFTFVVKENGTFTLTIGSAVTTSTLESISYSTDSGETWVTTNNVNSQTVTITTPTISQGNKVMWKGNGVGVSTTTNNSNRPSTSSIFSSSGEFDVEGNILSLIYGDDFIGKDYVSQGSSYNFALLFYCYNMQETAKVVSAKNMVISIKDIPSCCFLRTFQKNDSLVNAPSSIDAETIGTSGCGNTFYQCQMLKTAPELLTTTLGDNCYQYMFFGCTSLTTAPQLPATTLGNYCYQYMFSNCTSLTTAPQLLATTLGNYCYQSMFRGCTSLTTAPTLSATTLAQSCYYFMFYSCTSLTTAPQLLATTLQPYCYQAMFQSCTSLTTAPTLSATTLAEGCYAQMFQGCTSLATAPTLSATTLAEYCYFDMFSGCTSLNSITCLATSISATNCTYKWVEGVASSGTFTKAASMTSWTSGANGIPTNWSVQNA